MAQKCWRIQQAGAAEMPWAPIHFPFRSLPPFPAPPSPGPQSWALSSCTPAETLTPRRLQTGAESNTIKLSEGNTGDRPCGTGVGNELAKAEAPQGKARCAGLAGEHPQWQKTVTSHAFHELLDPPVSTLRGRRQSQVVHLIRH